MKYLILLSLIVAIFHFVYEGIIAPSLRIGLRNRLFVIRDRLREMKIRGLDPGDDQVFWLIHEGVNAYINRLPYLTLRGRHAALVAYKSDEQLQARVEKRIAVLAASQNEELKELYNQATAVVEDAFIVNMAALFIYIIPTVFLVDALGSLKRLAKKLLLTPEQDTSRLVPQTA